VDHHPVNVDLHDRADLQSPGGADVGNLHPDGELHGPLLDVQDAAHVQGAVVVWAPAALVQAAVLPLSVRPQVQPVMVSAQAVEQRRGRGRGSGGRAPDLLVLAAPLLLDLRPLVRCRCRGVAVEQRAAPGLVRAAPVLLVLGPLCHPLRQTLLAVVGRRCRRGRGGAAHVRGLAAVDTLRQRPGAGAGRVRTVERWTPTQLMRTAPVCLAVGPSRLGVLLSSGAVVGLRSRSGAANLLLFAAPLHSPMLLPVPRLQGGLAIETLLFLLLLLLTPSALVEAAPLLLRPRPAQLPVVKS